MKSFQKLFNMKNIWRRFKLLNSFSIEFQLLFTELSHCCDGAFKVFGFLEVFKTKNKKVSQYWISKSSMEVFE
jgi:hypothetical protein